MYPAIISDMERGVRMTEPNDPPRPDEVGTPAWPSEAGRDPYGQPSNPYEMSNPCLLYTSDAADE